MAITTQERTNILKLTVGLFNAAPGANYLSEFTSVFEANGHNLAALAGTLGTTGAFQSLYPNFQTASEFATKFLTTLGLQGNTEAVDFVTAKFNAGVPKAQIIFDALVALDASTSAEFAAAKAILDNKAAVAENYSVTLGASSTSLAALQGALANVTADPASVTAANAANAGGNGQTFTLTANVDNVPGTSGNDTVIGGSGAAGSASTLGSADVINGGAGTDTMKITTEGATVGGLTVTPNLTSMEKVEVQALTTTATTVNMVNATGTTEIWNVRSTDALTVNNVQELATVAANGLTNQNYTVNFKDTLVAGTADTVSVVLDNATVAALKVGGQTAGGFETVNLTAKAGKSDVTGAFDTNFTTNTGTKTINIDGAGSVRLRDIAATVTTIDASKNTGGADVHIDAGTALAVTFTGGAGDDQIRMENTLTTQDVIDGGAGRDTIHVTNGAHLVAGLQVKNIEQLDIAIGQGTYNMDRLAGIDTLVVSNSLNAAGAIVDNLAKGAKIVLGGENTAADLIGAGDLTVNVKDSGAGSANDVIAINVNSKVGVTTAAGSDLNIANIETVNITASSANAGVTHAFAGAVNLTHALTINVTADTAALTLGNLDALALVDFNASASTKAVSITTGADTFTAAAGTAFKLGAGNDTLNLTGATGGNTANDADATKGYDFVINGGKGGDAITLAVAAAANKDLLVYAAGDSLAGVTNGANNFDTITNFDVANDKIDLKAFGFSGTAIADLAVGAVATVDTTSLMVNAASQANFFGAGANQRAIVYVDLGADSALYIDSNKDGSFQADTDVVIKLAGIADQTGLTAADFVFA